MTPGHQLIDELLALNGRAAALGEYEAAYHALMGALHLADHEGDIAILDRMAAAADEQDRAIEAVQPPHHLSRAEAARRGQVPLYQSVRVHIDAVRLRLQSARQIGRSASSGPPR